MMEAIFQARIQARAWVTRSAKDVLALCKKEGLTKYELNVTVDNFKKKAKSLEDKQAECEKHLKPDEMDSDMDTAQQYERQVMDVLIEVDKVRDSLCVKDNDEDSTSSSSSASSSALETRLPKMDLPKFSGNVHEYTSFWEQFAEGVHNKRIPDVSKFSYLRSLLEGDAKAAVSGLSLTSANYATACQILEKRWGRPEKLIFHHVQELLSVSVPNRPSVKELWHVHDTLYAHICSLASLGITGEQYGVILTPLVLSRFPPTLRLEWAREAERKDVLAAKAIARAADQRSSRDATADDDGDGDGGETTSTCPDADLGFLMEFLQREIRRRERSQTYGDNVDAASAPAAASLHTASRAGAGRRHAPGRPSKSGQPRAQSGCGVCHSDRNTHSTAECPVLKALSFKDKRNILYSASICTKCLHKSTVSQPHDFKNCPSKCAQCNGPHHTILCTDSKQKHDQNQKNTTPKSVALTSSSSSLSQHVLLQTLRVSVGGRGGKKKVLILFDTGADRSYVTQNLVEKIKPEFVESTMLSCASFGSAKPKSAERRDIYNVTLGCEGKGVPVNATCVPTICAPLCQPSVPTEILKQIPSSDLVSIPAGEDLKVDVLVGMDFYWSVFTADVSRLSEELVAHKTHFGWVLSGRLPTPAPASGPPLQPRAGGAVSHQLFCQAVLPASGLQSQPQAGEVSHQLFCQDREPVESLWLLEAIGIADSQSTDDHVWSQFESDIKKVEGRYAVGLPWRDGMAERLKPNRASAQKRLDSLTNRLNRDEDLMKSYSDFFKVMEEQGIVEEVPVEQIDSSNPVYYMPHHPVVKESSTSTKVRPVFDASAKGYNGFSLNDCVHTGPNLLPDLVALLIRFRRWKVALTADVVKAFLQVAVHPSDRDAHRFLWKDRVMRFTRVPFGNRASPFLLCATIRHHLAQYPQSMVVTELTENLYMDDWMSGCDSEALAQQMFHRAKEIMSEAGMTLAKWTSNSLKFADKVAETTKVLGMQWTTDPDYFSFEGVQVPSSLCLTKRGILSLISRLFDPLGLLNPFTIRAKILFQSLWKENFGWDQTLSQEWKDWFGDWLSELAVIKRWSVPRRYFSSLWSENPTLVLHAFGDASPQAYGACVYLVKTDPGGYESSLIISRARVAPIKEVSLPRLELLGALLCARLIKFVRTSLKLDASVQTFCWTDSTVTLAWINGEPHKWKTFVANRVNEIRQLTNPEQWGHCPGKLNPADLLTRGVTASELTSSECWLHGPTEIMCGSSGQIPTCMSPEENHSVEKEMRTQTSLVACTDQPVKSVFDINRHSKWTKALRVMAYVLRFIHALKGMKRDGELTFQEMSDAKLCIFKSVQSEQYVEELRALKNKSSLSKGSAIRKLSPFIDENGLLRVKGRLQYAALTADAQHPILIPKGHLATLLIRHAHLSLSHAGVNSMIVFLRNCYWIVGARPNCKKVKRNCLACQRFDASTCEQQTAPLPEERVKEAPPFSVSGIDHAGPLFCSDFPGKKFYILLFTCAVIRAVHLELVDSMSQKDTTLALRRFIARRGLPAIVWSDNAKSFKATNIHFQEVYGDKAPDWKFIVPRAPWWGGFWERMVGTVKAALRKTLGKSRLCRQELETVLHEVESVVNSRPLTFVSDELSDTGRPLTPSHFLLGRSSPHTNVTVQDECYQSSVQQLKHLISQLGEMASVFWEIWRDDYLKNLRQSLGGTARAQIQEGEVVLIDGEGPRVDWPLGVVETVHPSRDGLTRTVTLRTAKGQIIRPIQRICHLEMNEPSFSNLPLSVCPSSPSQLQQNQQTAQPPVPTNNAHTDREPECKNKEAKRTTRSGRVVQAVEKLNL